ncbi:MAG: sec-independent protein translocase protein TatA [Verrucomicrobiales bacterium]|jgi:sec-independent protein translocase protein TatA
MGPIGGPELILIFVVVLLLFGAKKLPELARGMGKSLGEFKKAKDEFEHEIMTADQDAYKSKSETKPSGPTPASASAPTPEPQVEKSETETVAAASDTEPHSDDSDSKA